MLDGRKSRSEWKGFWIVAEEFKHKEYIEGDIIFQAISPKFTKQVQAQKWLSNLMSDEDLDTKYFVIRIALHVRITKKMVPVFEMEDV